MNIVLLEPFEVNSPLIVLTDGRAEHIVKILKAGEGARIRVGVVGGLLGVAEIVTLRRKYPFRVELSASFDTPPPAKHPVDFILALPRPIMLRRILGQIASLGVGTLHIVNGARVEKSFWRASLVAERQFRPPLIQGLEQAMDTVLPEIVLHPRFKPFVEDYLPTIASRYSHLLYAHPRSPELHAFTAGGALENILVAIGPEGGWVEYEAESFAQQGMRGFSLGPRILRVDTAVVNVHGRIMAAYSQDSGSAP